MDQQTVLAGEGVLVDNPSSSRPVCPDRVALPAAPPPFQVACTLPPCLVWLLRSASMDSRTTLLSVPNWDASRTAAREHESVPIPGPERSERMCRFEASIFAKERGV